MFSLVGIFTLVSVTAARPGILQTQTSLETIGSIVNHIPTAITHQSRTEIHNQQPVISQILAPVLRTIPVQTILQANPIIASQIQPSILLDQNQQQILEDNGQQGVIEEDQTSEGELNDQREILRNQAQLIDGQRIVVGDNRELTENGDSINGQNLVLSNGRSLADAINASELQLNGNIKTPGQ